MQTPATTPAPFRVLPPPIRGERVFALRKRLGLTQLQFAKLLGTTGTTVVRWERGYRHPTGLYRRAFEELEAASPGA